MRGLVGPPICVEALKPGNVRSNHVKKKECERKKKVKTYLLQCVGEGFLQTSSSQVEILIAVYNLSSSRLIGSYVTWSANATLVTVIIQHMVGFNRKLKIAWQKIEQQVECTENQCHCLLSQRHSCFISIMRNIKLLIYFYLLSKRNPTVLQSRHPYVFMNK